MKFGGIEPQRCEDIKEIVAPEIDPKSYVKVLCTSFFQKNCFDMETRLTLKQLY